MEFRLTYRGPLKSTADVAAKQELRRHFHPQIKFLWEQLLKSRKDGTWNPLKFATDSEVGLLEHVGPFTFAPLVSQVRGWNAITELEILFLRPTPAGALLKHGGDLDNRIKVLLDGLRRPNNEAEMPRGDQPRDGEDPFHCLLQDDALVTGISVFTDQLLGPVRPDYVELIVQARIRCTRRSMFNDVIC